MKLDLDEVAALGSRVGWEMSGTEQPFCRGASLCKRRVVPLFLIFFRFKYIFEPG
jgi:hypothetical protein